MKFVAEGYGVSAGLDFLGADIHADEPGGLGKLNTLLQAGAGDDRVVNLGDEFDHHLRFKTKSPGGGDCHGTRTGPLEDHNSRNVYKWDLISGKNVEKIARNF